MPRGNQIEKEVEKKVSEGGHTFEVRGPQQSSLRKSLSRDLQHEREQNHPEWGGAGGGSEAVQGSKTLREGRPGMPKGQQAVTPTEGGVRGKATDIPRGSLFCLSGH